MKEVLNKVLAFAEMAHEGQERKLYKEKYIDHCVRVMEICKEHTTSLAVLSAALLHDVLEKTEITKQELQLFLEATLTHTDARKSYQLVVDLTDEFTKDEFPLLNREQRKSKEIQRLSKVNALAQTIKYADIIDNCTHINVEESFFRVYLRECKMYINKLQKGHRILRKRASEVVQHFFQKV